MCLILKASLEGHFIIDFILLMRKLRHERLFTGDILELINEVIPCVYF